MYETQKIQIKREKKYFSEILFEAFSAYYSYYRGLIDISIDTLSFYSTCLCMCHLLYRLYSFSFPSPEIKPSSIHSEATSCLLGTTFTDF